MDINQDLEAQNVQGTQGNIQSNQDATTQQTQDIQDLQQNAQKTQDAKQNLQTQQDIQTQDITQNQDIDSLERDNLLDTTQDTQANLQNIQNEQIIVMQQISEEASRIANDIYKQIYGEDFDNLTATPQQIAFFQGLVNKYQQDFMNAYRMETAKLEQEKVINERLTQVEQLAEQRLGKETIEKIKNEIIPELTVREFNDFEKRFDEAILKGDINSALAIYEEILAKTKNSQQSDNVKLINPAPTSSPAVDMGAGVNDINQELLDLAG